jgi:hypothetical protein
VLGLPRRPLTDMDVAGEGPTGAGPAPGRWRVPGPVLIGSLKFAAVLMIPLAIVYASAGGVGRQQT